MVLVGQRQGMRDATSHRLAVILGTDLCNDSAGASGRERDTPCGEVIGRA